MDHWISAGVEVMLNTIQVLIPKPQRIRPGIILRKIRIVSH